MVLIRQLDLSGKKLNIKMERLVKTIFNIVFFLGFHINPSFSQSTCQSYTYFDVPGARPSNPVTVPNSDCRSYCFGNNACKGFTQQNGNCLVNTGDENAIDYNTSSVYTAISRNANSCNTAQNCSYSWTGNKNTFAKGGRQNDMGTINGCIASCQSDNSCNALDWDTIKKACFIFDFTGYPTANTTDVYHFDKNCIPFPAAIVTTTLPAVSSQSSLSSSNSTTGTKTAKSSKDSDWYPLAIKPAYIVLAGLGGGCLLLVLTAVIILCGYPMNAEEVYSSDGVVVKRKSKKKAQAEAINMESATDANVEQNPYYTGSEIDSPDLTKDTYLM